MNLSSTRLFHWLSFISVLLMIFLVNQLANQNRWLIDFTEDKKYSLHPASQSTLAQLEEPVYITFYLDGQLPSNFRRFQKSIRQMADQLTIYGGNNIQYRFLDPSIAKSNNARNQFYRSLIDKGLQPSNVTYTVDGNKIEKLIFPGAVISKGTNEVAVNLLKSNRSLPIDDMLNQSIEGLEYELLNAISQLGQSRKFKVGLVTGHNEPDSSYLAGLTSEVLKNYDLYRLELSRRSSLINGYDALLITKPQSRFSEREKYYLDQFVMGGGSLLIFMDALSVNMTEAAGEGTIAIPVETNLEDLLFKYGVRINKNYVADANCGTTPVVSGMVGNQPKIELLPWPYSPIITNYGDHPIVKNLDASWLRHVSSIDTVKATGIKKTPLLKSSEFTRVFGPPVRVSYNDLRDKLRPEFFTSGVQNLAYLLEGSFTSLYQNRILPRGVDGSKFRDQGKPASIIVIGDGDFIRNDFNLETDEPLPIGVDPYQQTTYANGAFVTQALDYMLDDDGLMLAKNKEVQIRPLDKVKLQQDAEWYKWLNMLLPIVLIVVFGLIKGFVRRKKYAR
jgi:gliding-associated putative ABC transporter substrate-binding component GldG